jgi:hypothetical protein
VQDADSLNRGSLFIQHQAMATLQKFHFELLMRFFFNLQEKWKQ